MAEITAQKTAEELYNKLSPMEKQQYDGVMGMGGFKQRYEENPTSQFVLGDVNYGKFKAIADAQAASPQESFLDKINIFSSASAAEPDKISSVSNTSGFQTILKPDGTIEIVPVEQTNNLPFTSMADMAAKNANLNLFPSPQDFYTSPTYLMKQAEKFNENPFSTGIMTQAPLKNLGFDTSFGVANEPDDEEDVEGAKEETPKGIAKLFEFLQKLSPINSIAQGIGSFFNPKGSDFYRPATQGILGYTPAQLNQMNALGGYYSEPARAQRRAEKRLANLIRRRDEGKSYSQKNLDMLTAALSGAPSQAQFATEKAAGKSSKVGVKGFTARDDIRDSRRGRF